MATKMCFLKDKNSFYVEKIIEFEYIKGMAFSQKQKNVKSFHTSISKRYPQKKILEVSTKSDNELGVKLSAFNLKLDGKKIESIYQSAKVFKDGKQFEFLDSYEPRDARNFITEQQLGTLLKFRYNDIDFSLEPKTLFYDYIYIKALMQIPEVSKDLIKYDIFTDIEFNEKKQVNCQARACAIYASLLETNKLNEYLLSIENFKKIYGASNMQLGFLID